MVAIAIGMIAFVASGDEAVASAPNPALGNALGAACGFTWTFTLIGLRSLARDGGGGDRSFASVVAGNVLGAAFSLPFAWPIPALDTSDVVGLVYLGVFQIGLAYVCIAKGMARVRALDASLLLLIEPMLNPIWTYFVHGERPTALACVGAAVIFAATTVKSILDARAAPPVGERANAT
ncbi:MAG: DMT family transporter [Planctomycetes bacterium]|nr:DMT family transporter [Planctomycetota bacterium]